MKSALDNLSQFSNPFSWFPAGSSLDRTAKSFGLFVVLSINDSLIQLRLFFSARNSTQQRKIKSSLNVEKRPSITCEIASFFPNFS